MSNVGYPQKNKIDGLDGRYGALATLESRPDTPVRRKKNSLYGKCRNEECDGASQHSTGYCVECRKRKCKRPGCEKITIINLKSSGYCDAHYSLARIGI